MKKMIIGLTAIITGILLLIGTFFLPQRDPFIQQPPEKSPFEVGIPDVTENNLTISAALKGYSTLEEFKTQMLEVGYSNEAFLIAIDNKDQSEDWLVSPSGRNDKLLGGESKNGVIIDPIYANDPNGAIVSDIKNALSQRDKKFLEGTLVPNIRNNRTVAFMVDTYKTRKAFEEWYQNKKLLPETKILKNFDHGVIYEQNNSQNVFYDLKKDSNAATVGQILQAFS